MDMCGPGRDLPAQSSWELHWALCWISSLTLAKLFSFSTAVCPCLQGDHQVEEISPPPQADYEEFMPEEHFARIDF